MIGRATPRGAKPGKPGKPARVRGRGFNLRARLLVVTSALGLCSLAAVGWLALRLKVRPS